MNSRTSSLFSALSANLSARLLVFLTVSLTVACSGDEAPVVAEKPAPAGVRIDIAEGTDAVTGRVQGELTRYLTALTGSAPITSGDPELLIVLEPGEAADDDRFRLVIEDGEDSTTVRLIGHTRLSYQYAGYELLRQLGVRFYHPEQEWVPELPAGQLRARAKTRTALAPTSGDTYVPDFIHRSYTFHGAHPLEHLEAFSDGDHPIDEAQHVNEWAVKNRGDRFRGMGRGLADEARRKVRAEELETLRLELGMRRGTGITLHNQQQGASAAIDTTSDVPVQEQIETLVTARLESAPDTIEFGIHFGPTELTVTPDQETVEWLNWAGRKALELRPDLPVFVNDHTSGSQATPNFDDLGCPNGTNDEGRSDYYDLAFHTDERMGVQVHTVMFYPLSGAAPVYDQKSFSHKLCLMKKASAEGRPLRFFPEGSWWLSFDNPIPVYLPLYLWTRHMDIELVKPLLLQRGGGTLRGHKMFNSGHEWGYWQQDYGVGLWHWNADVSMAEVLGELADPLCPPADWPASCEARDTTISVMTELMAHQAHVFLEAPDWSGLPGGLYTHFAGEDPADELAANLGFEFRPVRVPYAKVAHWEASELEHFLDTDMAALKDAETRYAGWLAQLQSAHEQAFEPGRPWIAEIIDGVAINMLRARQQYALYAAVMPATHRPTGGPWLAEAEQTLVDAEVVIRRREAGYRYPAEQVSGHGENGTTYPWRVHGRTTDLHYWKNRHGLVLGTLSGEPEGPGVLSIEPVFATPGTGLTLKWPALEGATGTLAVNEHTAAFGETDLGLGDEVGVWAVSASIDTGTAQLPEAGAIARSNTLRRVAKGGLTVVEPDDATVNAVIGGLAPAFELAFHDVGDGTGTIALVPEPVDFRGVVTGAVTISDGAFVSAPITILVPIPNPGGGGSGVTIKLTDAVLGGETADGDILSQALSVDAQLPLQPVVDALIALAGFDEPGAYQLLAGFLGFDVTNPPDSVPVKAELPLLSWE